MIRPFKPSLLILIFLQAAGSSQRFRGGSQKKRDRWFGLEGRADFDKFRRWWHRVGKDDSGGLDFTSKEEADAAYDEWVSLGLPEAK